MKKEPDVWFLYSVVGNSVSRTTLHFLGPFACALPCTHIRNQDSDVPLPATPSATWLFGAVLQLLPSISHYLHCSIWCCLWCPCRKKHFSRGSIHSRACHQGLGIHSTTGSFQALFFLSNWSLLKSLEEEAQNKAQVKKGCPRNCWTSALIVVLWQELFQMD